MKFINFNFLIFISFFLNLILGISIYNVVEQRESILESKIYLLEAFEHSELDDLRIYVELYELIPDDVELAKKKLDGYIQMQKNFYRSHCERLYVTKLIPQYCGKYVSTNETSAIGD